MIMGIILTISLFYICIINFQESYIAIKEIKLGENLVLPRGSTLTKKASMPEGYDVLTVDVRVMRGLVDDYFIVKDRIDVGEEKSSNEINDYFWIQE